MRLAQPRVLPLSAQEWASARPDELSPPAQRDRPLNIVATLARRREALIAFRPWADYIASRTTLSPRQREIIILRIGWLCRSGYEWGQHVRFGLQAGLTAEEIERVKVGAEAAGWCAADALLIKAADALHGDHFIGDTLWAELSAHFDQAQRIDLVLIATQYVQVSTLLNTFGVQLEDDLTLDPEFKAF